jgi:hypothetical protein
MAVTPFSALGRRDDLVGRPDHGLVTPHRGICVDYNPLVIQPPNTSGTYPFAVLARMVGERNMRVGPEGASVAAKIANFNFFTMNARCD